MSLESEPAATGEWECMECGYTEEGLRTQRPKVCPECNAPGQALEFFPNEDDGFSKDVDSVDEEDREVFDDEDEDVRGR